MSLLADSPARKFESSSVINAAGTAQLVYRAYAFWRRTHIATSCDRASPCCRLPRQA
jgi:hypothetical protein